MAMKSKILLGAGIYLLSCAAAQAQLNVGVSIGQPEPVYAAPAPVYVAPYPSYYDPHHRYHDAAYWHHDHRDDHRR